MHLFGSRVGHENRAAVIAFGRDEKHGVGSILKDRLEALFTLAERFFGLPAIGNVAEDRHHGMNAGLVQQIRSRNFDGPVRAIPVPETKGETASVARRGC